MITGIIFLTADKGLAQFLLYIQYKNKERCYKVSVEKGTWVQIRNVVLKPEERTSKIPNETKQTPLYMWVKGHLNSDGNIGELAEVTTVTGRKIAGILEEVNPVYTYGFGESYVPEILEIDKELREIMNGGNKNE